MAVQQVNPNRMELLRLRRRLVTARRGHKLLKDKRDELMRQFLEIVRETYRLRLRVDQLLSEANRQMVVARAVMPRQVLETALLAGHDTLQLDVDTRNIMGVKVPVFSSRVARSGDSGRLPYSPAGVPGELDAAVLALSEAFPVMLRLAEIEKTTQLLADEIARTRRRVNSLEYVMIPELSQQIRSITMKMDENERGNLTRLMKVKDMIIAQEFAKAAARREAADRSH